MKLKSILHHRRLLLLFLLGALPLHGYLAAEEHSSPATTPQGLLVVLTTGEPEAQMMAMVLATHSLRQGAPVEVLLCGEAGDLALLGAIAPTFQPAGRSPVELLGGLIAAGARVSVCALYLPNREASAEDLLPGVSVATPPEMAARLLATGVTVLSL